MIHPRPSKLDTRRNASPSVGSPEHVPAPHGDGTGRIIAAVFSRCGLLTAPTQHSRDVRRKCSHNAQICQCGEKDAAGNVTLGGSKVKFHNAAVSCLWMSGTTNRVAEEFALRMNRETGCLLADVDCGRVIDPGKLAGLNVSGQLEERRSTRADEAKKEAENKATLVR
jgi:hypothetical protein